MTPTLSVLPEIVRGTTETVREVIDRRKGSLTPRQLEDFIAAGTYLAGLLVRIGEEKAELEEGSAVATILELYKDCADTQAHSLVICKAIRDEAEKVTQAEGRELEGFADFLRAIEAAEQAHERVLAVLAWLQSPRPAVDPAAFGDCGGPPGAEGYEGSDSVLARLRAGGEL